MMKHKKLSLLGLTLIFLLIAACGSTEERAGADSIAKETITGIKTINTSLEKYEELEDGMMTDLNTDLTAKNATKLLNKQTGAVGKNFKERETEIETVQKEMKQIKKNLKSLTNFQEKKAVDVPEKELTQAIQTLKQLEITYDLFDNYYQSTKTAETDFYNDYSKDISKEDLAKAISTINRTHGAAYQQLEVLTADLSSASVAMQNLTDAINQ